MSSTSANVAKGIFKLRSLRNSVTPDILLIIYYAYRDWVKTGDNSIEATGITSSLLIDDTSTEDGPANFVQTMAQIDSPYTRTQFDFSATQHAIRMGSYLEVPGPGPGMFMPQVLHWGNILPFNEEPLELTPARHDFCLRTGLAEELGAFNLTSADCFFTNGVGNKDLAKMVIIPKLMDRNLITLEFVMSNKFLFRELATCISPRLSYFNNELLYAKLLYYSMVIDEFTFSRQIPVVVPFKAADIVVNVVDLSYVNLDPNVIIDIILKGELIILDGWPDISIRTPNDWQIMHWISSEGCRLNAASNNQSPHSCYLHWPAIPIHVLANYSGPVTPNAALVTSQELILFARRLASRRCEWSSFTKGLYLAMDLIGIRMVGDHTGFWPVRSCLSPTPPQVPTVRDYNFIFRLLGHHPPLDRQPMMEGIAYDHQSLEKRVKMFTLYTAVLATATTTLMYDVNLTVRDLIAWGGVGERCSYLISNLMYSDFNSSRPMDIHSEPAMIRQPKKAFKLWLGCGVADRLYQGEWGQKGHYANVYAGLPSTRAPRYFSALCIDNWLLQRPIEWGIVGPCPRVHFSSELRGGYSDGFVSWSASMGSQVYGQLVSSEQPMKLAIYGAQAINAITQMLRMTAAPNIENQFFQWHYSNTSAGVECDPALADATNEHDFIPEIHAFEPLSIRSFDHQAQNVRAPVIVFQTNVDQMSLFFLRSCEGQTIPSVGLKVRNKRKLIQFY